MQTRPLQLHSTFHNSTHLELIFHFMPLSRMMKWSCLINLLQNFCKLQTLIIEDEVFNVLSLFFQFFSVLLLCISKHFNCLSLSGWCSTHNFGDEDWEDPKTVPECLLSHLTKCTLRNCENLSLKSVERWPEYMYIMYYGYFIVL